MNSESNPANEQIIDELYFIMDNLCEWELNRAGRRFIYQRINYYKDRQNAIDKLQNSGAGDLGDIC
jgi:hypothetical protein